MVWRRIQTCRRRTCQKFLHRSLFPWYLFFCTEMHTQELQNCSHQCIMEKGRKINTHGSVAIILTFISFLVLVKNFSNQPVHLPKEMMIARGAESPEFRGQCSVPKKLTFEEREHAVYRRSKFNVVRGSYQVGSDGMAEPTVFASKKMALYVVLSQIPKL